MDTSHPKSLMCKASGQSGVTLLEVLVSMLLIGLLVGALTASVLTTASVSADANGTARANALLESMQETMQQLDYRPCSTGDLVSVYTAAFEAYEAALPQHRRVVSKPGITDARIVSVDANGGCSGGAADSGEQTIGVEVTYRSTTRSGALVKRDPAPADGPIADFDHDLLSNPGDPLGIVALDASKSTPRSSIIEYSWDCGDAGPPGDPANTVIVTSVHNDAAARCRFNAGASDANYTITLTILDNKGVTNAVSKVVTIPAATSPRLPPVAVIQTTCGGSSPCAGGNAVLSVDFDANASNSLEGTIVSYQWDFGDPLSGSANTSANAVATHEFIRDQINAVKLTVTDDIGLTGTATVQIDVNVIGAPPPTAAFTVSPVPAVAPQNVTFDAAASHAAGGGAVDSYWWDFGDGTNGNTVKPVKLYNLPGNYTVTLTVTAGGVSASTQQVVVVKQFDKPFNFRLTDAEGEVPFIDDGRFYFAWTNGPESAGDTVKIEINVEAVQGCLAFGSKTRTVDADPPGTTQAWTWVQNRPASNVCAGSQYRHRARAVRISPTNGTSYSDWTQWVNFYVTRT